MATYKKASYRQVKAFWYWASTGENWKFKQFYLELFEHCLANSSVWHKFDAFTSFNGGVGSGYNSDMVDTMFEDGERFQLFHSFGQAARYAYGCARNLRAQNTMRSWREVESEARALLELAAALEAVEDIEADEDHAHNRLCQAFFNVFRVNATAKEKREAMNYAN